MKKSHIFETFCLKHTIFFVDVSNEGKTKKLNIIFFADFVLFLHSFFIMMI